MLHTLSQIFLMVCFIAGHDLLNIPEHQVVLLNQRASFRCKDSSGSNKSAIWKFHSVGSMTHDEDIYRNGKVTKTSGDVIVNDNELGRFDLIIEKSTPSHAGTYSCIILGEEYKAQLVILKNNMTCQTNKVQLKLNDAVEMWCSVEFWGNWRPTIQWYNLTDGSLVTSSESIAENRILNSSLRIPIDRSTTISSAPMQFKSKLHFAASNDYGDGRYIPEYPNEWISPVYNIYIDSVEDPDQKPVREADFKNIQEDTPWKSIILVAFLLICLPVFFFAIWKFKIVSMQHHPAQQKEYLHSKSEDITSEEGDSLLEAKPTTYKFEEERGVAKLAYCRNKLYVMFPDSYKVIVCNMNGDCLERLSDEEFEIKDIDLLGSVNSIAASEKSMTVFLSFDYRVVRIDAETYDVFVLDEMNWDPRWNPKGLSVNSKDELLVVVEDGNVCNLRKYSASAGNNFIGTIQFPECVYKAWHAVESTGDNFLIAGRKMDEVPEYYFLFEIATDGKLIWEHPTYYYSPLDRQDVHFNPACITIDDGGKVFVSDTAMGSVFLFDPEFNAFKELLTKEKHGTDEAGALCYNKPHLLVGKRASISCYRI